MNDYTQWETMIAEALTDILGISYGDATGLIMTQPFIMSQGWGRDDDPTDVARKIADA